MTDKNAILVIEAGDATGAPWPSALPKKATSHASPGAALTRSSPLVDAHPVIGAAIAF